MPVICVIVNSSPTHMLHCNFYLYIFNFLAFLMFKQNAYDFSNHVVT